VNLPLLLGALLLEAVVGYPDALYRRIGHPVSWIGAAIDRLDRGLNRPALSAGRRRANGVLATGVLVVLSLLAGELLSRAWLSLPVAASLLAQRSLASHVAAVAAALRGGGLAAGRAAVAHIVGRNPEHLDEAAVARAAIESLAENFSDGVVAPALWCGLLGLPGILAYKAINTADSMIGHRTARHAAFGWAAARLDDWVNLPASRLAGFWIICAAGRRAPAAWRTMWRDAGLHRSPNAGWPEAAMAGALGLRLNGPRVYGSERVEDAWMGDGRSACGAEDIDRALRIYWGACVIQVGVVALLWW